jgi:hypothetical protein
MPFNQYTHTHTTSHSSPFLCWGRQVVRQATFLLSIFQCSPYTFPSITGALPYLLYKTEGQSLNPQSSNQQLKIPVAEGSRDAGNRSKPNILQGHNREPAVTPQTLKRTPDFAGSTTDSGRMLLNQLFTRNPIFHKLPLGVANPQSQPTAYPAAEGSTDAGYRSKPNIHQGHSREPAATPQTAKRPYKSMPCACKPQ